MRKQGAKLLTMYWFLMLILISGGVTIMVFLFYGNPYDVRELEADLLLNRVVDCVSPNGYVNSEFFGEDGFKEDVEDIEHLCNLHFSTEKVWIEPQYFFRFEIRNFDSDEILFSSEAGNKDDAAFCDINLEEDEEKLAKCVQEEFYSPDNYQNKYRVRVLSVVRKTEKNVG